MANGDVATVFRCPRPRRCRLGLVVLGLTGLGLVVLGLAALCLTGLGLAWLGRAGIGLAALGFGRGSRRWSRPSRAVQGLALLGQLPILCLVGSLRRLQCLGRLTSCLPCKIHGLHATGCALSQTRCLRGLLRRTCSLLDGTRGLILSLLGGQRGGRAIDAHATLRAKESDGASRWYERSPAGRTRYSKGRIAHVALLAAKSPAPVDDNPCVRFLYDVHERVPPSRARQLVRP